MRISDVVAGLALIFTIFATLYFRHRSRLQAAAVAPLRTQVKIETLSGTKKKPAVDDVPPPGRTYRGTFVVNDGRVELDTSHFHIRRKSYTEFFEVHVFAARFDEDRLKPVVEAGHKIFATPVSGEAFKEALAEAESVSIEFRDVSGRIFRSPELGL